MSDTPARSATCARVTRFEPAGDSMLPAYRCIVTHMTRTSTDSPRRVIASAFVAFAAFGSFWGVWGASVPRVQRQVAISAGQLGFALLFVGAGALPAMLLVGRALDRWGLGVAAVVISALGGVGAGLALTAVN